MSLLISGRWLELFHGLFCLILISVLAKDVDDYVDSKPDVNTQVEVRAVFINCEPDERQSINSEGTRFEREELFKHSALRDCNKKIALTIKIASESDLNSGDEYIPIEHVYQGSNKRIRLLNPYILRLRREPPLQAYKLRRIETVRGILTNSGGNDKPRRSRLRRGSDGLDKQCTSYDIFPVRDKHHEHNIKVEATNDIKSPQWIAKDRFVNKLDEDGVILGIVDETSRTKELNDNHYKINTKVNTNTDLIRQSNNKPYLQFETNGKKEIHHSKPLKFVSNENNYKAGVRKHDYSKVHISDKIVNGKKERGTHKYFDQIFSKESNVDIAENEFTLYEIGNPDLWYAVHVQLFEKLSTPEGNTVWNDITKGDPASVSTLSPEWTSQDINVRYRPAEWIQRNEFTLPMTSLCLLAPIGNASLKASGDNTSSAVDEGYIVVPGEDIVGLEGDGYDVNKRDENYSNLEVTTNNKEQCHRRVIVRASRALFGGTDDKLGIAYQGADEYLTLPYRRPHHAQIDLEARADENQLVLVGSSGRISTVVSDSTRRTRTVLSLQATNTGLAAARFRVVARDCGPELSSLINQNGGKPIGNNPILVPPRHTRRLQLEIPIEIPVDVAHCSGKSQGPFNNHKEERLVLTVALINDDDDSVAIREVLIKKGDRCFCVWHCECVCLSDDPKLLCREMTEPRQAAAGLTARERPRHIRSICYHDVITLNILITIIGVIMLLLLLGLAKALAGLVCRCVGSWGLDRILQTPRKIDHYYESALSSLPVVYDNEGWPVNPYTKKRTVQIVSKSMEFILNVIFFITVPCLIVYDGVRLMVARRNKSESKNTAAQSFNKKNSKCFNSQDIQDQKLRLRRRRAGLRRWMTPEAEDLSTNIWRKGLLPPSASKEFMQPLLHEQCGSGRAVGSAGGHESYVDSEQDDTDYVLMQMQKSKESLARSQRKQNDSGLSSVKNQSWKAEAISKTITR